MRTLSPFRQFSRCSTACWRPSIALWQRQSSSSTGTASAGCQQVWIYVDTVFPIRFGQLDPRILLSHMWRDSALDRLKQAIPVSEPEAQQVQLTVEEVVPREKDGGAFARVSYTPCHRQQQFEDWLKNKLDKTLPAIKPWWLLGDSQVHLVKGKPWLEDMDRYPNHTLNVTFENGSAPPQERLYDLFRPYGRIKDIVTDPKSATILYHSHRSACAARNCLDNYTTEGEKAPTIHILFQQRGTRHSIWAWLTSHPRIVLPFLAILFGSLSFFVFDPLRSYFIESKVTKRFDLSQYRALAWLKRETLGRLGLDDANKADATTRSGIEKERDDARTSLQGWLSDGPESFIVISGPRGSGKGAMLQQVLLKHPNVISIDCMAICKKENNERMIAELAKQIGYFPLFGFLNSINNLIDLASVGVIGQKAGFSTSPEAQIKQILDVATNALTNLSSQAKAKQTAAARQAEKQREAQDERNHDREALRTDGLKDGRLDTLAGHGPIAELGHGVEKEDNLQNVLIAGPNSKTEAKNLLQADDSTQSMPVGDGLPVIVLRDFNTAQGQQKDQLWDALADFGAALVENKVAHVVVTSDNILVSKPLEKAMPSRPLNSIFLVSASFMSYELIHWAHERIDQADSSASSSIEFVKARLAEYGMPEICTPQNEGDIELLGGRLSDLEVLLQKIRGGSSLHAAVEEIVMRATSEIKKSIYGQIGEDAQAGWTQAQAWYLTKLLSSQDEASYEDVLINGPFTGDAKALRALEQAGMIAVLHRDGQTSVLRPGRPVWRAALRKLTQDRVFSALQELALIDKAKLSAASTIKTASDELVHLSVLFSGNGQPGKWIFTGSSHVPVEMAARVDGLLAQMREAQEKTQSSTEQEASLKAVLKGVAK